MNHSEFFSLIRKGNPEGGGLPGGFYLLHGEEEYVKAQAVKLARDSLEKDFRDFNFSEHVKPPVTELSEICETLPLFTDLRIVAAYELADGTDPNKYVECFKNVPSETALLMVFKGKLPANSAVLKFAVSIGREVLFDRLSPNECMRWCMKHASENGVLLDQNTARVLVGLAGPEMANLVSETDKLIDFAGPGGTITPQDVSACIKTSLDVRIFDMLDMFTYGKPADGLKALHALIDEGNEPMSISAFLVSRFKLMLEARRGIEAGRQKREVAAAMEGNRYANEKAYDAARRFTMEELSGLIRDLSDMAYQKISGAAKEEPYLEMILLKHEWRQFPV